MHLVYIDESGDVQYTESKGTKNFVLSALIVPEESWNDFFGIVKDFRTQLKNEYGIQYKKELHATKFLKGKGRPGEQIISKYRRTKIAQELFEKISNQHELGIYSINVCLEHKPGAPIHDYAIERLVNRLQRTLKAKDDNAILIFDEGKENLIRKMTRKMRVYNPIPSMYGSWGNGEKTKNIQAQRILADPFFKESHNDFIIQVVDFIAFSLLKYYEPATPHVEKYQLDQMFPLLEPILFKNANRKNPLGVVR